MRTIGVIPSRFGSTRLPGKPLLEIEGKPMIQWVIEAAQKSRRLTGLIVATDHPKIAAVAKKAGCEAVMTESDLPSGTDRVWQAVADKDVDCVINIQGDEPLLSVQVLDELISSIEASSQIEMATLGCPLEPGDLESQSTAKIVLNQFDEAIYFSRFPIPFSREEWQGENQCLKHIGLYGYKKSFLKKFCESGPAAIEKAESLEQLRALYLGARIKVVRVIDETQSVDTQEDLQRVIDILKSKG